MGCGASKGIPVQQQPLPAQPAAAIKVESKPAQAVAVKVLGDEAVVSNADAATSNASNNTNSNSNSNYTTAESKIVLVVASDSGLESNDETSKSETDVNAALAEQPAILERPSSQGGLAFNMTFDGEQARTHAPARLEKLRTRTRSAELTVDELGQQGA